MEIFHTTVSFLNILPYNIASILQRSKSITLNLQQFYTNDHKREKNTSFLPLKWSKELWCHPHDDKVDDLQETNKQELNVLYTQNTSIV